MNIPKEWPTREMVDAAFNSLPQGADVLTSWSDMNRALKLSLMVAPVPKPEPFAWVLEFNDPDPQTDIEFQKEKPEGWPADKCYPLYKEQP